MTKPLRMEIAFENIPAELIERHQWCLWRWEERDGKWTKPCFQANGSYASSTRKETWSSFQAVRMRLKVGGYDGIGFFLSKDNGYVGVDFDDAKDAATGFPKPWAKSIIDELASYTEISPSGRGFKTLVKAKLPGPGHHEKKNEEELGVFDNARYFCITGHLVNGHKGIEERQEAINQVILQRWPGDLKPRETPPPTSSSNLSDGHILKRASRDAKFMRLWTGDISGYPSQSEADSALIMKLLFYTGNDLQRTDSLFRQSKLMRDKWERQDYRDRTIQSALSLVKESSKPAPEIRTPEIKEPPNPTEQKGLAFPEVMSGLAGDFAKLYSSYLEVPPSFLFMAFLTCLGHVLADRLTISSELFAPPRLYVILLGESGDSRKSTAISKTVDFFMEAVQGVSMCWGVGSAEGLQKRLGENSRLLLCFDEFKQFVSKCKIEASVLLPCVNILFESNRYESHTKTSDVNVENAHLSMLAASTIHTYENTWEKQFTDIGFNNRLFLVPGSGERKFPIPVKIPESEKHILKDRLGEILKHASTYPELKLSPDANKFYEEWYFHRNSSIHAIRIETYAMRLMSLFAINELKPEVDEVSVWKITELCNWQIEVRRLYDPIDAENQYARMEEKIRRVLTAKGPLTNRQLRQYTNTNANGLWIFNRAIETLIGAEDITFINDGKKYVITQS